MLSVAECRALLGDDAPELDSDVEALRDLVYLLADAALDLASTEARDRAEREAS